MSYRFHRHNAVDCPDLGDLEQLASTEGHSLVSRTRIDWVAEANRFDQPGEVFYLAVIEDYPVGMCGLNRDPYVDDRRVGRLRHLYVHPEHRRSGLAAQLVSRCLSDAPQHFHQVRLRTTNPAADSLYRSLGFQTVHDDTATHALHFDQP